mmetsp:Transcript_4183/g.13014  ORF Transcript_4183/g.13014 Transcript_4183/m.13014 type:complete len:387 (+) Transcript_4183:258-1418(+)
MHVVHSSVFSVVAALVGCIASAAAQSDPQCYFLSDPPDLSLPCRFYVALPAGTHPHFTNAADGGDTSNCNLNRKDTRADVCGGAFDAIHTWTVLDTRSPTGVNTVVQTIHVTDTRAPTMTGLPNATAHYCEADGLPDHATITAVDSCGEASTLPVGEKTYDTHVERIYAAEDNCGNRAEFTQLLFPDGTCAPTAASVTSSAQTVVAEQQPDGATTEVAGTARVAASQAVGSTKSIQSTPGGVDADSTAGAPLTTSTPFVSSDGVDPLDALADTNGDGASGKRGKQSTTTYDLAADTTVITKGGKKQKKNGKGKKETLRGVNAMGSVAGPLTAAAGIVAVVGVLAIALKARRMRMSEEEKLQKQPLIGGATASDGLTYAYDSIEAQS